MSMRPGALLTSVLAPAVAATLAVLVALAPASSSALARYDASGAGAPRVMTFHSGQSTNWSGYTQGVIEKATIFQSVSGEWVVPTATYHAGGPSDEASSSWVGIGGGCIEPSCLSGDPTSLIQAGTEQDVNSKGVTSYSAWWEIVPVPSITITSVAVHPGDVVRVTIADLVPGVWTIKLSNLSDGQSFSTTVPYPSTMLTAEWVEEAPLVITPGSPASSGQTTLPLLSTVHFDRATVNGHAAGLAATEQLQMINGSGKVIAAPSAPDTDTDGFDDCVYASSCPAPSSELP
jgi:hypothetical protein